MTNKEIELYFYNCIRNIAKIPDDLIIQLYSVAEISHIKKGELFIRAGEISEYIGFNLNGIMRLYYNDYDGNDYTKGFCTEGRLIISYSALVEKRESYFNIEAIQDTDILRFKYSDWIEIGNKNQALYTLLYKLVETIYIIKEQRERSFLLDDATTRYLNFLKEYTGLENRVSLTYIASFLGIKAETLSRIRKKLQLI